MRRRKKSLHFPRRKTGEQTVNLHGRARLAAQRSVVERAELQAALQSNCLRRRPGKAGDVGHGGDARQRFTAKSERRQLTQVAFSAQLARGVAVEGKLDFVRGDAVAVVGDQNALRAAALDFDPNVARTGIERVFNQLLHHRSRSLDHLARGDLGREVWIEHPNRAHVRCGGLSSRSRRSAEARRVTRSGTPARRATWTP